MPSLKVVAVRGLPEGSIPTTVKGIGHSKGNHQGNDESAVFASCNGFGSSFSDFFLSVSPWLKAFEAELIFFLLAVSCVTFCFGFPALGLIVFRSLTSLIHDF